ncbi:TPA: hypothetical protein ACH3X3_005145 [Trebouxia sp. C0006]
MEQYVTPLIDEDSQASYQSWSNQLEADKRQRQLKMLHDKMSLQKDFLPPGLAFEQLWARVKYHSRNPRVLEYLYRQRSQMDHIIHECHATDKRILRGPAEISAANPASPPTAPPGHLGQQELFHRLDIASIVERAQHQHALEYFLAQQLDEAA